MPESIKILILAILQGVAEFLPISSSGHLVLVERVLKTHSEIVLLTVALHAGTLLSILIFYRREWLGLLLNPAQRRTAGLVIAGTLPLVGVGLFLKNIVEQCFTSPWVAVGGLIFTAGLLLFLQRIGGKRDLTAMTFRDAVWIGVAQCVAILPGVSRSGTTISMATRLGISPEAAARFSFYLAVPAIGGAITLEGISFIRQANDPGISIGLLLMGFAVAAIVGYFSLAWLIRVLRRGKLAYFGYYCLGFAALSTWYLSCFSG